MKRTNKIGLTVSAVLSAALLAGCGPATVAPEASPSPSPSPTPLICAVDSLSGNVLEIDPSTGKASSTALVSTKQNASAEIALDANAGFVAVGSYSGNEPGLYRYDREKPAAGATRVGEAVSAQYLLLATPILGFLTSADNAGTYANALYRFDPSSAASGLTKVADLSYPQEMALAADGRLYVAEYFSGKVVRFNADCSAVETEIATSKTGTTGLLAGSYRGKAGVFVANTGEWSTGSVDFIAGTELETLVTGPVSDALALLDDHTLLVSGGFPAKTYLVDLSASKPAAVEVLCGGASFGGGDACVLDGVAYVADGKKTVYAVTAEGKASAIAVGNDSTAITNLCVED